MLSLLHIILNFYKFVLKLNLILVLLFIISNLIEFGFIESSFIDNNSRLTFNNFIFNLFYYYWTNFWFLIPVILTILILTSLINVNFINFYIFTLWILLIIYFITLNHYWCVNSVLFEISTRQENLNSLLTNSINKYHPFLFYSSTLYLLTVFLCSNIVYLRSLKFLNYTKLIPNSPTKPTLIILTTLALGGWWALQEGSWGGWWNWDPSEVFGLLIMIFYVTQLHTNTTRINSLNNLKSVNIWFLLIIVFYTIIQLNFDLVSHNFGTKTHQFVNSYYMYLIIMFIALILIIRILNSFYKNVFYGKLVLMNIKTYLLKITLTLLILYSFSELIINCAWSLFGLNLLNTELNNSLIIIITLVLIIVSYSRITTWVIPLLLLIPGSWVNKSVFLFSINIQKLTLLHILIFIWLIESPSYLNQSISEWITAFSIENENSEIITGFNDFVLKLNTVLIELSSVRTQNNYITDNAWSFFKSSSNTQVNAFIHSMYNNFFNQILYVFNFEFYYSIKVIDFNTNNLFILIGLVLYYAYKPLFKKTIIIF